MVVDMVKRYFFVFSIVLVMLILKQVPISGNVSSSVIGDVGSNQMVIENIELNNNSIQKLQEIYQNQEIIGKISLENTNQMILVVKGVDNEYYQTHTIMNQPNLLGTTYMDYRNQLTDSKLVIYNYYDEDNMLRRFLEESYYENHTRIRWETLEKVDTYQIFAVMREDISFHFIRTRFERNVWQEYLKGVCANSIYDTKVGVEATDDILILQSNNQDGYYIQLFAKRMNNS